MHPMEGTRRKRSSQSNKGHNAKSSMSRLAVPDRDDDNESSSLSRSDISTPLTPEREDFNMMPVTSVTIKTVGRH